MPPTTPIKSVASPRIRPVPSVSTRPGPIKRSWIVVDRRRDLDCGRSVYDRWGRCILVHRRWGICVDVSGRWAAIGGRRWWCGRRNRNVSGFRPAKPKTSHRNRCDHSLDNVPKMCTHGAYPFGSFSLLAVANSTEAVWRNRDVRVTSMRRKGRVTNRAERTQLDPAERLDRWRSVLRSAPLWDWVNGVTDPQVATCFSSNPSSYLARVQPNASAAISRERH
jgi:hypothetical protein